MIHPFLLEQLIQLINQKTGLAIRPKDRETLAQKIITRARCLKIATLESYYQLLANYNSQSQQEWEQLIDLLTTGESYFFRDQGQIDVLRRHILPELIQFQRHLVAADPCRFPQRPALNIWSAGCSTGEEVYSLAILLIELLPDWKNWHLRVLGTDINPLAIASATAGLYNDWSFRLTDPHLKYRYFESQNTQWRIKPEVKSIVQFRTGNLVLDPIPKEGEVPIAFDLIICRNVFIYFMKEAIDLSLKKFCSSLRNKGYLITSHTELYGHELNCFEVQILPESVIYQKRECDLCFEVIEEPKNTRLEERKKIFFPSELSFSPPGIKSSLSPLPRPPVSVPSGGEKILSKPINSAQELVSKLEGFFHEKTDRQVIEESLNLVRENPRDFEALFLIAQSYANLGELDPAIAYAKQCLSLNSFAIEPYYLLAQIAEEKGEIEQAKFYLNRIIYLDPRKVIPYLDLGGIYAKEGQKIKARKFWSIALELLQKLPSKDQIDEQENCTVEEIIGILKKRLKQLQ